MSDDNIGTYRHIKTEFDGDSLTLTIEIDRPEVLNALNNRTKLELNHALESAAANDAVGAVILLGSGDRAFSVGADLKDAGSDHSITDFAAYTTWVEETNAFFTTLDSFPKAIVAAVNGYATGSGLGLAFRADIMIGTPACEFCLGNVLALGLAPTVGQLRQLAKNIGEQRMWYFVLTGKRLAANEALEWGLLSEIVELPQLKNRAIEIGRVVAAQPHLAVKVMKEAYRLAEGMSIAQISYADWLKNFCLMQANDTKTRHASIKSRL